MTKLEPWQVLESRLLLERRWLGVHEQRIGLPHGGEIAEFHLLEAPNWSAVLAETDDQRLILVEQYRHGAKRISRELPAGVIDGSETPLAAAQRELREETGYVADEWHSILDVHTEPSRHTNRAHFFFCRGAKLSGQTSFDPSENIRLCLVSKSQLLESIDSAEIIHGLHVGAILMAMRKGFL